MPESAHADACDRRAAPAACAPPQAEWSHGTSVDPRFLTDGEGDSCVLRSVDPIIVDRHQIAEPGDLRLGTIKFTHPAKPMFVVCMLRNAAVPPEIETACDAPVLRQDVMLAKKARQVSVEVGAAFEQLTDGGLAQWC